MQELLEKVPNLMALTILLPKVLEIWKNFELN
jgi:hypothetical protein